LSRTEDVVEILHSEEPCHPTQDQLGKILSLDLSLILSPGTLFSHNMAQSKYQAGRPKWNAIGVDAVVWGANSVVRERAMPSNAIRRSDDIVRSRPE